MFRPDRGSDGSPALTVAFVCVIFVVSINLHWYEDDVADVAILFREAFVGVREFSVSMSFDRYSEQGMRRVPVNR